MLNTSYSATLYPRPLPSEAGSSQNTARTGTGRIQTAESKISVRDEMNLGILQASAATSLKAGNQSQALLFRSAIDRINELLAPSLGPDAIQSKATEDNSAEATAERILSLSTGFFDAYKAQRPGDDPDQVAKDFVGLIRGGFEKGFNEAKDILKGLSVLSSNIESGIMKTYDLVSKGYDDFLASKLSTKPETEKATEALER